MFKNPFSFKGRIRRTEFGISYIIYIVLYQLSALISIDIFETPWLLFLFVIPLFYFFIAQGAKRCHDRGNSGWYQLIPFYILWMIFADSENGVNEYGPNPKGIGNVEEIDDIGKVIE